MLWYVAIIAALNLGLGYLWGAYVRPCPRCAKARAMGLSLLMPAAVPEPLHRPAPYVPPVDAQPPPEPRGQLETTLAEENVESEAELATETAPPPDVKNIPLDPVTGLVTREHAEQLLAQLTGEADERPVTIGLIEVAPIDWIGEKRNDTIDTRVLCGVSNVVRQSLADDHTLAFFTSQQFLLLAPHEDVQQATRRAEELRQRVATTEFVADGRAFQTTVTCALAELGSGRTAPKLFEFLQEALDEAKRYGGNRTFMHDGGSPAPVVPAELTLAVQQLAI